MNSEKSNRTQHKEAEHMHLEFLTPLTSPVAKTQSSWVKMYYLDNILLSKGYQMGEIPVPG
jgi:hypothetical protein